MKVKEFMKELEDLNPDSELSLYVWDCEYDEYNPSEIGKGKLMYIKDGYVNIRVN